jgi:hypothetical protein
LKAKDRSSWFQAIAESEKVELEFISFINLKNTLYPYWVLKEKYVALCQKKLMKLEKKKEFFLNRDLEKLVEDYEDKLEFEEKLIELGEKEKKLSKEERIQKKKRLILNYEGKSKMFSNTEKSIWTKNGVNLLLKGTGVMAKGKFSFKRPPLKDVVRKQLLDEQQREWREKNKAHKKNKAKAILKFEETGGSFKKFDIHTLKKLKIDQMVGPHQFLADYVMPGEDLDASTKLEMISKSKHLLEKRRKKHEKEEDHHKPWKENYRKYLKNMQKNKNPFKSKILKKSIQQNSQELNGSQELKQTSITGSSIERTSTPKKRSKTSRGTKTLTIQGKSLNPQKTKKVKKFKKSKKFNIRRNRASSSGYLMNIVKFKMPAHDQIYPSVFKTLPESAKVLPKHEYNNRAFSFRDPQFQFSQKCLKFKKIKKFNPKLRPLKSARNRSLGFEETTCSFVREKNFGKLKKYGKKNLSFFVNKKECNVSLSLRDLRTVESRPGTGFKGVEKPLSKRKYQKILSMRRTFY